MNIDIEEFKTYILDFINRQKGILKNPKAQVFSKGINFEESTLKISFWIKDFNKKEKIHQSFYDSGGFSVRQNINCLSFSAKVLIFHSLI